MYQQYIGGKLVTGLGKPLDVLDPSTGEVVGTVGSANAAQAQQDQRWREAWCVPECGRRLVLWMK